MQTKTFDFAKLRESGKSNTLKNQTLTVQMTSQPAWYAVMALPYLMEYPYECSEQTFNRLYANSLARHIANSDPKIRKVFDQWKNTPALESPLFKNQDLKAVTIEETPWLRDAVKESEARRNVGILFDDNRLNEETGRLMHKLAEMQNPSGAWPWFPGGPDNDYITLYITTGFGRLRHLGVQIDQAPAIKSLTRLDAWVDQHVSRNLEARPSGGEPPVLADRPVFVHAQFLSPGQGDRSRAQGSGRLLDQPGAEILAEARQSAIAGAHRHRAETLWRF